VARYRQMAEVLEPKLRTVSLRMLADDVQALTRERLNGVHYSCRMEVVSVMADPDLLGQAVVNLLHNAVDAVTGRSGLQPPVISLSRSRPNVQADQGQGHPRACCGIRTAHQGICYRRSSGFFPDKDSLKNIKAPIQLWASEQGGQGVSPEDAAFLAKNIPSRPEFHPVPNSTHMSFIFPCSPAFAKTVPAFICGDPPGFDRAAFHRSFNRQILAFFPKELVR
jgi:hypothetical protein